MSEQTPSDSFLYDQYLIWANVDIASECEVTTTINEDLEEINCSTDDGYTRQWDGGSVHSLTNVIKFHRTSVNNQIAQPSLPLRTIDRIRVEIPITVKTSRKCYTVCMIRHCIFCLRKITTKNDEELQATNNFCMSDRLQEVPCAIDSTASASTVLFTLNKIWSYLQKGGNWNWDNDYNERDKNVAEFSALPVICWYCAKNLYAVENLMFSLIAEVNKLGRIIRDSKYDGTYSWRAELFEQALNDSSVEDQTLSDTLEFLGIVDDDGDNSSFANEALAEVIAQPKKMPEVTLKTVLASNITETACSDQPLDEQPSYSQLNFCNEGSANDDHGSYQNDDFNDDQEVTLKIVLASNITETACSDQPLDEKPSYSQLNFCNEGSANDDHGSCQIDDFNDDPKVTLKTVLPSNITETACSDQPLDEKPSYSQLNFCNEGSAKDDHGSYQNDDFNDDPDYIKKEECTSSDGENSVAEDYPFSCAIRPNATIKPTTPIKNVTFTTAKDPTFKKKKTSKRRNIIYTCIVDGCGQTFRSWSEGIKVHQLRKHNIGSDVTTGKVSCDICCITYMDKYALRNHRRNVHRKGNDKPKSQNCDMCKVEVPQKDLYQHVFAHVGEEYMMKCPAANCPNVYCTLTRLSTHLKRTKTCRESISNVKRQQFGSRYICDVCGEDIGSTCGLRDHILRAHENGPKELRCPIQDCRQRFCVRQSVLLHIPLHINNSDITKKSNQECDICKEEIKAEEMEQHLTDSHQVQEVIKCYQCPFMFSVRENLVEHLYEHRHSALFCDICGDRGAAFFRHHHLRTHYFSVHQIGRKFFCEHCQKEFMCTRNLEEHVAKHHLLTGELDKKDTDTSTVAENSKGRKMFKCDECHNVEFKMKSSWTEHQIKLHGADLLPCKFCDKKFTKFAHRSSHEREHRGEVNTEGFLCPVDGCGKTFKSKGPLKNHMSGHNGVSHACEQCGKSYTNRHGLTAHVQSVHMGVRNQVCDVCGESFYSVTILKRHKLIHTGERPFSCKLCGQTFRHKEVLKRHMDGHEKKGSEFKPNGPMKQVRKRVEIKKSYKCS